MSHRYFRPALCARLIAILMWLVCGVAAGDYLNYVARVVAVIDGDTVELADGRRVRLIGINAPERARPARPAEPYAEAATQALRAWVQGVAVQVSPGREPLDRYKRVLAYLRLPDGRDVQELLLAGGYAAAIVWPPNIRHHQRYQAAEDAARAHARGLWAQPNAVRALDRSPAPNKGFHVIRGRVSGFGAGRKNRYVQLEGNLSLQIRHHHWQEYWSREYHLGQRLEARGWIHTRNQRHYMVIRHPAAVRVRP